MMSFFETWYLPAVPIVLGVVMNVWDMIRMQRTSTALQGIIRNRQDLQSVRVAINLSMTLAVVDIVIYAAMIATVVCFVVAGWIELLTAAAHLMVVGVATLPVGLYGKHFEKRIKDLRVVAEDPQIAEKYRDFLVQWGQPRLKLPD